MPRLSWMTSVLAILGFTSSCVSDTRLISSRHEVVGFVERCDQSIVMRDWAQLERCFLPTAKVVYQQPREVGLATASAVDWIRSIKSASERVGYSRERSISDMEFDADDAQTVVHSRIQESFLAPGVRHSASIEEVMVIVIHHDSLQIASIGYRITSISEQPL